MLLVVTMLAVHSTAAWPALVLAGIVLYCCVWELADLLGVEPKWKLMGFGLLAGLIMGSLSQRIQPAYAGVIGLAVGVAALLRRIIFKRPAGIDAACVFWVIGPVFAATQLQQFSAHASSHQPLGPNLVLLTAGPLWIGDTAALVFGKKFGRHALAPNISPNKTWEGAIANFIFSIITGAVLSWFIGPPLWVGAAVGAIAGVTGQVGDLLQSALKRSVDKKDSGGILPGHGGLLDRLDSLLFSFPFSHVFLLLVLGQR